MTHNEALLALDMVSQAVCEGAPANDPPIAPALGGSYIVGADPVESWSGKSMALATWTAFGWRFATAFEGMSAVERGTGVHWNFINGQWTRGRIAGEEISIDGNKVVGPRLPAILDPTGGALVDVEVRQALSQILARLRAHGLIAS